MQVLCCLHSVALLGNLTLAWVTGVAFGGCGFEFTDEQKDAVTGAAAECTQPAPAAFNVKPMPLRRAQTFPLTASAEHFCPWSIELAQVPANGLGLSRAQSVAEMIKGSRNAA